MARQAADRSNAAISRAQLAFQSMPTAVRRVTANATVAQYVQIWKQ